ncbi:MAG: alanine racemase [Clostridia bacterium]|nr:alanine racemase [Clostridia bacterium]
MEFFHRTWAEIDLKALENNLKTVKNTAENSKIMAVIKANAYGHSVELVAPALEKVGVDFFAVSNISEALQLRDLNIKTPILILGYTPVLAVKKLADNNISQCVYSSDYAKSLSDEAVKNNVELKIHIKLDTGMSRLGFDCRSEEITGIDEAVTSAMLPNFSLEGIFTHFAESDRTPLEDDGFTDRQFARFKTGVKRLKESGLKPKIVHCCNSAATLLDSDKRLDLIRAGIVLYGLSPNPALELKQRLDPVMTLKSVVSMVKTIKKGDSVNYGRTFTAEKDTKIATVAAGYADGYPRALSNKAYVLISGKKAPIVGRVCMDQLSVDVSEISDTKIGDEVILFGKELSVDSLAEICGTINYEIICNISPRVPRILKGS